MNIDQKLVSTAHLELGIDKIEVVLVLTNYRILSHI